MASDGRTAQRIAGNHDTAFLKYLALLAMLVDHVGVIFFPSMVELRIIGRMAFPLYAWCLVVGSVKTRSPLRYGLRLLLMAAASQPLYMMALNHSWSELNILFTLLFALIAIQGIRMRTLGSEIWVPALCYVALGFFSADYGWRGLTFILVLYLARGSRSGLVAAYLAYALFWGGNSAAVSSLFGYPLVFLRWPGIGAALGAFFRLQGMVWLSLPLVVCPMRTGIRMPRWLGYALYPLHLVLLIVLKLMYGYTLPMLLSGF